MTEEVKKYLSTSDLAAYLNISLTKLGDMVRSGAIPKDMYWQHNRTYRFDCRRVEQHLLDSEFGPEPDPNQSEFNFDAFSTYGATDQGDDE